jgi:hypothetical protein
MGAGINDDDDIPDWAADAFGSQTFAVSVFSLPLGAKHAATSPNKSSRTEGARGRSGRGECRESRGGGRENGEKDGRGAAREVAVVVVRGRIVVRWFVVKRLLVRDELGTGLGGIEIAGRPL